MTDGDHRDLDLFREVRQLEGVPAILRDRHLQVVASNRLARALTPGFVEGVNLARFTFIDSAEHQDQECWDDVTSEIAAMLRDSLDQTEQDDSFRRLVGELSATSHRFATAFAGEAEPLRSGIATFQNTPVGDLQLRFTEQCVDPGRYALMVFDAVDPQSEAGLESLSEFLADDPFDS